MENTHKVKKFLELVSKFEENLKFDIAEIGAHPYEDKEEPFYTILDFFPKSKIYAFEIDKDECEILNKKSKNGVTYYPYALGRKKEKRKFYETEHPMCSSLYEPNEKLLKLYNNLGYAYLKNTSTIDTISLDDFIELEKIENLDFIKIDVQGAELDVFQGSKNSLNKIIFIISEAEFIEHYINQPLFGDICSFLKKENISFHKFLHLGGRSLRPLTFRNNLNFAIQHIWTDAVFTKDIHEISKLDNKKLLKLSVLSFIYNSPDLTYYCLNLYDKKNKTKSLDLFKKIL